MSSASPELVRGETEGVPARPVRGGVLRRRRLRPRRSRHRGRRGAASALLGRVLGPRARRALGVVSPIGWAVLAASAICALVGFALHVTELSVIAVVLAVPLGLAVLSLLIRPRYRVAMDLTDTHAVVGQRAVGRISVSTRSRWGLLPSRFDLAVGSSRAQFVVPRLRRGIPHEELFAVPTRRRQILVVGPVRSVREDPLGLVRRRVTWARPQEVYVHPRTVPLEGAEAGYLRDLEGTPSSALSSSDIAFHALRDYVPGDDLRHVHWRTTARTGRLMVRQFEETRRSHVVVALDNHAAHHADAEEFELAVAVAASLSAQTLREERQLTALSVGNRLSTRALRPLLDDYTVVAPVRSRTALRDLGRQAADSAPNASAVIFVVGSPAPAAELALAASQLPAGVLAIAVQCTESRRMRRRRLGTLELISLGRLEDLPRAMRTVTR